MTTIKHNPTLRNQALYLMDGIYSIGVKFPGNDHEYTYLVTDDYEVAIGDIVLVPDVATDRRHFKTVEVTAVHDIPNIDETAKYHYQFIAGIIDSNTYLNTLYRVNEAVDQFAAAKQRVKRDSYRKSLLEHLGDDKLLTLTRV